KEFRTILARQISVPLGFGLVTGIFFIAIIYYLIQLGRWVENTDRVISNTNLLMQLIVDHETAMRGFALTGQEEFLEPYRSAQRRIKPLTAEIKALLAADSVQIARIDAAEESYRRWLEHAERVVAARRTSGAAEVLVGSGQGKKMMDEVRQQIAGFLQAEELTKVQRQRRSETLVMTLSAGYFIVSLLFSGLMAYGGRSQLRRMSDTYGRLLATQRAQNDELEYQSWLRAGESRIADRIIGQLTPQVLAQNVLAVLADYIQVVVGAIYTSDEEGGFSRLSSYGFSREMSARPQSFALREGLAGQAAAERRPIFLDTLQSSFFLVNSALGETQPAAQAIVPLHHNGDVVAILELGFLQPLSEREKQLLQTVAGNLGVAIATAGYRLRLQESLLDVQQLNEELQAQQEELSVINGELEEQSKILEESQFQLEAQQAELEQSNQMLEQQREMLQNRNETLQQTQNLLEEHAHQLERASHYKSEFLANMSHELRTPLNSQLILSQILAENVEGNLTPEQVRNARTIYAAGNDLLALINDVLDISRVEAGKLEVRADQVMLSQVLEGLSAAFAPHAREKQLQFDITSDPDVPGMLYTDRHRLEQILRNLLANAIKFTDTGSVSLRVAASPRGRINFMVTDTGVGISEEQVPHIFEPFYQGDSGISRKYGGTGLGLSISRQLAGLLGGHIDVTSAIGSGSVFTFDMPVTLEMASVSLEGATANGEPPVVFEQRIIEPRAASSRRAERRRVATPQFSDDREQLVDSKKTILVIEDEIEFARVLYTVAHELNYQCVVATSAEEGLELAELYPLHGILLDMKLPDHSGMTILAHLKAQPQTRHVPVHVISVEDRTETALHLGAVGYLLKPASHEQLREVFATIERRVAYKTRSVLVAETPDVHSAASAALIADTDIEVVTVTTGAEVLANLRERSFDCLIVDYTLPDMDSGELLQQLSQEEAYSFPPVVVYTSRNLKREEEERLLCHSRSIVIKAARSPERLLEEVTLFLHKVEADLSLERRNLLRSALTRDRPLEGRRILLVDDDVRNIFALTSALERRGASVEIGRTGLDALQKLEEVADIDLILMDMMMPEMDGYEAMEKIRGQERYARLPIIAVTARAMRDDQERCLRAGANDYVAKPVDVDRLISLIQVWLPKLQRI
ncbi:MAG: response regulator, partial [Spongiibacteraceae bacterium]